MVKLLAETEFEAYFLNIPRAQLGGAIKEYIAESNHQGWDGYSRHDMTGIRKFLDDLKRYHETMSAEEQEDLGVGINNVNPVK